MQVENAVLDQIEKYIIRYFEENMPQKYVYHDFQHTQNVVDAIQELATPYKLTEKEMKLLTIAAWFHDTGYVEGSAGHEERSCKNATSYLKEKSFSAEDIKIVCECIMATKLPQDPDNLLEKIICDADLSHLGKRNYWDRCGRVRQELSMMKGNMMSEQEWVDFELNFIENHEYHTAVAKELYEKRKQKHIRLLLKQKIRLQPTDGQPEDAADVFGRKSKKIRKHSTEVATKLMNDEDVEIKDVRLGRGVETMYRTTYRTHVNLSSIADNKANIMLSINAIIISITISTLVPSFDTNPKLILPTAVLLLVCLVAIIFATLSTRPKITEGKFTREDIEQKKSNLLFFGNFYNMKLEDFNWGMNEMIMDEDFLYSTMTRDLYFLGKVLAKKYKYLSICYNIFMYGLIIAVITFGVTFAL